MGRDACFLNVQVDGEAPPLSTGDRRLGINNIAVCSDNTFYNSKYLKNVKGRYRHLKAELQSKGARSARRKLKEASGRERRFVRDLNHCAATYILDVLEGMRTGTPQVWNSSMYLTEEGMKLLDGTMDIYLTDLKYGDDRCAERLSGVKDYMKAVTRNHLLAAAQGEVIVRHLMLPGHPECCTSPEIDRLAENLPGAAVDIMDRHRPEHRAFEHADLRATVRSRDHRGAVDRARSKGPKII